MSSRAVLVSMAAVLMVALAGCGGDGDAGDESDSDSDSDSTTPAGTSACPLFDGTACEGFLDGCYAPDLMGECADGGLELTWTDGHKIQRTGANAGFYGPSDAIPCITLDFDMATFTSTMTNVATGETLLNQDLGDGTILITCNDGSELTFSVAELEEDNVCKGVSCG